MAPNEREEEEEEEEEEESLEGEEEEGLFKADREKDRATESERLRGLEWRVDMLRLRMLDRYDANWTRIDEEYHRKWTF